MFSKRKEKTSTKTKVLIIAMMSVLILSVIPFARSDYPDGFDSYASGTTSPGPWTQTTSGTASCFADTFVLNTDHAAPVALSPPNVYQFTGAPTAGCFTSVSSVTLAGNFNSSGNSVTVTFSYYPVVSASSNTSSWSFAVGLCGEGPLGTLVHVDHSTPEWYNVSYTVTAVPGNCPLSFVLSSIMSGPTTGVVLYIDNVNVKGANAVIPGANFFLVDYASQQWFNISDYAGSSISINYTSAFNCATVNMTQAGPYTCVIGGSSGPPLNVPDFKFALSGANLITVNVGGAIPYTRTLIPRPNLLTPTTPTSQFMYLDTPGVGSIYNYVLTIDDLTTEFPPLTTEVYLLHGSQVITSGPLDAGSAYGMQVPAGIYTLDLITPSNFFTYPLTLTAADATPKVIVQNATTNIPVGPIQQFAYSLGWDCDQSGITSSFTDTLGTMTKLTTTLYRTNMTGTFNISSHTATLMPTPEVPISSTVDFRNSSIPALQITNSTEYSVGYVETSASGTLFFGPYPVIQGLAACPYVVPIGQASGLSIPPQVLGLSQIFTAANIYEELIACIVVVMTAALIGARFAHIGMLILGMEMGLFTYMTWLPLAGVFISIVLFIGSIGLLANRARRPIT